jgi:hypothetical protein
MLILRLLQSIDVTAVVVAAKKGRSEFDSFKQLMQNKIEFLTGTKVDIDASNYLELFSIENKNKSYFGKEVILLLDEIDTLDSWSSDEKDTFLLALRQMKQFKNEYCLKSVMGITNAVGQSLNTKIGNSPFNVGSSSITSPYFTKEEFLELYKQYEDQEGIKIAEEIKDDIFDQTAGAQGLSVMFGEQFDNYRAKIGYVPKYDEWFSFSRSITFLKWFEEKANFRKMLSLINDDAYSVRMLIEKILFGIAASDVPESLIRANIMTKNEEFANPFVFKFISCKLNDSPIRNEAYRIPMKNNQIDFLQLIYDCIPYMNRLTIVGAPKMSTNYCLGSKTTLLGPKEDVYATTFQFSLQTLLEKFTTTNYYVQHPSARQSCDMVLEIEGSKIVIEHGANLKVEQNSQHRQSVHYHVKQQAEHYHKNLKANQSWVINWTTVPNGENVNQRKYYFPESSTVNTVYIYHDYIFTEIIVETKHSKKRIERKLPNLNKIAKKKTPLKKRAHKSKYILFHCPISIIESCYLYALGKFMQYMCYNIRYHVKICNLFLQKKYPWLSVMVW